MDCSVSCGGKCCKNFYLPLSPMEIDFAYKRYLKTGYKRWVDIEKIGPMVIYLGKYSPGRNVKLEGYHYTCKHLNRETGLCMDYENRPKMCSQYPYGGACQYRGCGFNQSTNLQQVKVEDSESQKIAVE